MYTQSFSNKVTALKFLHSLCNWFNSNTEEWGNSTREDLASGEVSFTEKPYYNSKRWIVGWN